MSRATELLQAAAEALNDGRSPLDTPFLTEHEVTADECFELADNLATAARLMAQKLHEMKAGPTLVAQAAALDVFTAMGGEAASKRG